MCWNSKRDNKDLKWKFRFQCALRYTNHDCVQVHNRLVKHFTTSKYIQTHTLLQVFHFTIKHYPAFPISFVSASGPAEKKHLGRCMLPIGHFKWVVRLGTSWYLGIFIDPACSNVARVTLVDRQWWSTELKMIRFCMMNGCDKVHNRPGGTHTLYLCKTLRGGLHLFRPSLRLPKQMWSDLTRSMPYSLAT